MEIQDVSAGNDDSSMENDDPSVKSDNFSIRMMLHQKSNEMPKNDLLYWWFSH